MLPIMFVTRPVDIAKAKNGKLDPCVLSSVYFAGIGHRSIHRLAARAWNALASACAAETGLVLSASGSPYRTYDAQVSLFEKRYVKVYNPLTCTTQDQRVWNGVRYWKRRGVAAVAVPGTSNHGLTPQIRSITSDAKGWKWLEANATKYGWSWELQSEPWHIRYVAGDVLPQAVIDFEKLS
jgi:LAS superfamily LD-carboxypeptidase LdcB